MQQTLPRKLGLKEALVLEPQGLGNQLMDSGEEFAEQRVSPLK